MQSPMDKVLAEITDTDTRRLAGLMTNHLLNTQSGWRPSDAARTIVSAWRKHDGTFERLRAQQEDFNVAVRKGEAWA